MFYYDRLKQHMEIINGKYKEHYFSIDSIEKTSKIFARSCDNNSIKRGDIITDIKNPAKKC